MIIDLTTAKNKAKSTEKRIESTPKTKESKDSAVVLDKQGRPITSPELLEEIKRIESAEVVTVKDKLRLHAIKKHGEDIRPQSRAKATIKNTPEKIKLDSFADVMETTPTDNTNPDPDALDMVINYIQEGSEEITACKKANIKYNKFKKEIEKAENEEKRKKYIFARENLGAFYIYKVHELQEKYLKGQIDNSMYVCLSRDFLKLAEIYNPNQYGNKITVDQNHKTEVTHNVNAEQIKNLNSLLNALPSPTIDADFEEVDQ